MRKNSTTLHKTIKIKTSINAPVRKVFQAQASVKERSKWSVPEGDAIKFLKSNFKVNGVDIFKCGPKDNMEFKGIVHYEDIVKDKRIVFAETVFHKSTKLSSALITFDFYQIINRTELILTIQAASYSGQQMLNGYKSGYMSVLGNLKKYLESK